MHITQKAQFNILKAFEGLDVITPSILVRARVKYNVIKYSLEDTTPEALKDKEIEEFYSNKLNVYILKSEVKYFKNITIDFNEINNTFIFSKNN